MSRTFSPPPLPSPVMPAAPSPVPQARYRRARAGRIVATGDLLWVSLQNGHFEASRKREEAPKTRGRGQTPRVGAAPAPRAALRAWRTVVDSRSEPENRKSQDAATLLAGASRRRSGTGQRIVRLSRRGRAAGIRENLGADATSAAGDGLACASPPSPALPCPATLPPETTVGAPGGRHERQHRRPG
jgi:hypothetical protein